MPFNAATKAKILKYQAYEVRGDQYTSVTLSDLIDEQLADIEDNLPDLIAVIEADLATMDTLDALLTTEQGSANATLVQADVLRWAENKDKTGGIQERFEALRVRVARLLNNAIAPSSSGGQAMLYRG